MNDTVTKLSYLCGVSGCFKRGVPATCPFDGARHHHGMVHYGGDYPTSALMFDKGEWRWLCEEHLAFVTDERVKWEGQRRDEARA